MRVLYVEDAVFLAEAVKHNLEKNKTSPSITLIMARMASKKLSTKFMTA